MYWFLLLTIFGVSDGFECKVLVGQVEIAAPASDVGFSSQEGMLGSEVSDTLSLDGLEIYPQPAQGVLFVGLAYSFGEIVRLELFDVLGRRVHAEMLTGPRTAIDVSGFARGVYFLSAQTGTNQRVMRKVVID